MNQNPFDIIKYPGRIHLVENDTQLAKVAELMHSATQFGFDTETRPSFRKGEVYKAALLQLATQEDAFVIRLQKISKFELIRPVLENPQIVKVGAAIRDDLKQLQKTFKFIPQNFIELQDVARKKGLQSMGLKGMAEEVLGSTLSKRAKLTNWEAFELTDQQVAYAATDAWIGLELYERLIGQT